MLQHTWLDRAQVQPYRFPVIQAGNAPSFRGGLVLADTPDMAPFQQTRRHTQRLDNPDRQLTPQSQLPGTHAYAGGYDHRFGHFMAECLHRILPSAEAAPDLPWVVVGTTGQEINASRFSELPGFVRAAYEFLGLSEANTTVIQVPTEVERLQVSELGSDLFGGPKPGYVSLQNRYTQRRLRALFGQAPRFERVYVSRSAYLVGGFLGHKVVDQAFAQAGFEVFHPEDHPLPVQMDTYRKAKDLVFDEGSSLHGLELIGHLDARLGYLNRRQGNALHFSKLLRTHSRSHWLFQANRYVGTLNLGADGREHSNKGIALFNLRSLAAHLEHTWGGPRLQVDEAAYLAQAQIDFETYVKTMRRYAARRVPLDPTVVRQLTRRFETAIAELYP